MNYSSLQEAIAVFLNKSDLFPQIPTFIALAEAQMNRRLRVTNMMVNTQISIANEYNSSPADFLAPISMKNMLTTTVLDSITPDAMAWRKNQEDASAGEPLAYSVVGSTLEVSPAPDASYVMNLIYYGQIPALAINNSQNWVLTLHPDAYLYGALTQAAPLADDARAGVWSDLYERALTEIENADRTSSLGARLEPRASLVI